MKKNSLSVCLFASGSKEHHISKWLSLAMNDWNLVGPWLIGYGESESGVGFSKFWIGFFSSMVVPTDEIPIFHKVWSKVIGYGESESVVRFSKFWIVFSNHVLFDPWSLKKILRAPIRFHHRLFWSLLRVGPPHNWVDLGVTWSDLSFALIKTAFFSRNSWENAPWNPIGGSFINTDQSGFTTDCFGPLLRVGPPHNGVDLGVTWSDLSFALKEQHFLCEIVERVCFQCQWLTLVQLEEFSETNGKT